MLAIAFTLAALTVSAAATKTPQEPALTLQDVFTCALPQPRIDAVVRTIEQAKGKAIIEKTPESSEGEYELVIPIDVFGVKTAHVGIQEDVRDNGQSAVTYVAVLGHSQIQDVARIAAIEKNAAGDFRKALDKHRTLFLVESGPDVLVQCAFD